MTYHPDDWTEWLKANPPPDLQALVAQHGSYPAITADAWADWDRRCAEWEARRKERLGGPTPATREALAEMQNRPSRKKSRK